MKYVKPYDQSDPDASYVNGNPGAGIAGSIPDALAFEAPLRELDHLVTFAGFTPSNGDLQQVRKSIQAMVGAGAAPSASLVHTGIDTNSAVNAIVCDVTPAITTYATGSLYSIKTPETNTGGVTANFNSLGAKDVLNSVGGALSAGDIQAGVEYVLVYNGTAFNVVGLTPSQVPIILRSNGGSIFVKDQRDPTDVTLDTAADLHYQTSPSGTILGQITLPAGYIGVTLSASLFSTGATTADADFFVGIFYRAVGASSWALLESQRDCKLAGRTMSMTRTAVATLSIGTSYEFIAHVLRNAATGISTPISGNFIALALKV